VRAAYLGTEAPEPAPAGRETPGAPSPASAS
jgi:hypothetical protein